MGTVGNSAEVADYKCKVVAVIQLGDFSPALVSCLDAGMEKVVVQEFAEGL